MKIGGLVVPPTHVRAGSRKAGTHTEWFEQHVIVEREEQLLLLFELHEHRARRQFHGAILKLL